MFGLESYIAAVDIGSVVGIVISLVLLFLKNRKK